MLKVNLYNNPCVYFLYQRPVTLLVQGDGLVSAHGCSFLQAVCNGWGLPGPSHSSLYSLYTHCKMSPILLHRDVWACRGIFLTHFIFLDPLWFFEENIPMNVSFLIAGVQL